MKYILLLTSLVAVSFLSHSQDRQGTSSVYIDCQNQTDKEKCLYEELQRKILDHYDEKAVEIVIKGSSRDTISISTSLAINSKGKLDVTNSGISSSDNHVDKLNEKILKSLNRFIVQPDNIGNPLSEMIYISIFFEVNHNGDSKNLIALPYEGDYSPDTVGFAIIDEAPIYPGCEGIPLKEFRNCFQSQILEHIKQNFRYPKKAQRKKISGRVNIMFTIGKEGEISKIRTFGAAKILMDEAHRIISLLPKMKPGKQEGKAVRVPFAIPITFRLR